MPNDQINFWYKIVFSKKPKNIISQKNYALKLAHLFYLL